MVIERLNSCIVSKLLQEIISHFNAQIIRWPSDSTQPGGDGVPAGFETATPSQVDIPFTKRDMK